MIRIFILFILMNLFFATKIEACTRVLSADKQPAVLVGRTMDWQEDTKTNLIVYPEGLVKDGSTSVNPIRWTTKYGSIVATETE